MKPGFAHALARRRRAAYPPIVCTVDQDYVAPLCALMRSLVTSHADSFHDLRLVVLHAGLGTAGRMIVTRHADELGLNVKMRAVRTPAPAGPVSGWVSEAVYLRLAIPEALAGERRVLYLDADTLVLRDLRPLLTYPLGTAAVAAVRDPRNPKVGGGIALPGWKRLGVAEGLDYFNSGVMLVNLPACARLGVFERARQFLTQFPDEARLWDQDALNVALDDGWRRLERCWNTFALSPLLGLPGFLHTDAEPVIPLGELLADEYAAAVLHFAGPVKPWSADYPAGPLRDLYRRFLPATAEVGR